MFSHEFGTFQTSYRPNDNYSVESTYFIILKQIQKMFSVIFDVYQFLLKTLHFTRFGNIFLIIGNSIVNTQYFHQIYRISSFSQQNQRMELTKNKCETFNLNILIWKFFRDAGKQLVSMGKLNPSPFAADKNLKTFFYFFC